MINLGRRAVLAAGATLVGPPVAQAQGSYPDKPIHIL